MERTLKSLAKEAKARMKQGFWRQCEEELRASYEWLGNVIEHSR